MAEDNLLYESIFIMFLGFLLFILSILNKSLEFLYVVNEYFVLFIMAGFLIAAVGLLMMVLWKFKTTQPYYEHPQEKTHFAPYLAIGMIIILTGFTLIFYYEDLSRIGYIATMSLSMGGIVVLTKGLYLFVKEAYSKKKIPQHS